MLSGKITYLTLFIILFIIILRIYETIDIVINQHNYLIIINFITIPILFLFLLFPIQFLISNICLPFLSVKYLTTNSKYYSCKVIEKELKILPSVTIQIPLYDENFKKVLRPMLRTCISVRDDYIQKGGKCNIIVNDDGIFKFINDDINKIEENINRDVIERITYYKKYNIAFTARQLQNRTGRFKKASNMNFCFDIARHPVFKSHMPISSSSLKIKTRTLLKNQKNTRSKSLSNLDVGKIENPTVYLPLKLKIPNVKNKKFQKLSIVIADMEHKDEIIDIYSPTSSLLKTKVDKVDKVNKVDKIDKIDEVDEVKILEDKPLNNMVSILSPVRKRKLKHKKHINFSVNNNILQNVYLNKNKKYMTYGDLEFKSYILLIDSDSVIPINFLENVVKEFEENPLLAYTQHYTIPLVSSYQNYFSRFISHFTINLNEIIFRVSTRNGDISPLIGHNIMIRKKALYETSYNKKCWSENRVSEDFDLCLRFTNSGYYGKFIAYKDNIFQEGVSLSFKDEMNKYSKFAYGASEIIFNPIKNWCKKGILTKSFYNFIRYSNAPFTSKIGIVGYLMTYFSIASSIVLTPVILVVSCYVEHWEILFFDIFYSFIFLTVLFSIINPISSYIVKNKLKNMTVSVINNNQYIPDVSFCNEVMSSIFFCLFYSSISFPIFTGVISHLFNLNISWGSTVKTLTSEKKYIIFFKIIRDDKIQFLVMFFNIGLLLFNIYYLKCVNIYVIISLSSLIIGHIITPFLLTPTLFGLSNYEYDIKNTPTPKYKSILSFFGTPKKKSGSPLSFFSFPPINKFLSPSNKNKS